MQATDELLAGLPDKSSSQDAGCEQDSLEDKASFPSLLVWHWLNPLIRTGSKRPLEHDDLPLLRAGDSVYEVKDALQGHHGVFRALWNAFGKLYLFQVLSLQPFWLLFSMLQVFAVRGLVELISQDDSRTWVGVLYALGMFGAAFLQALSMHHIFRHSMKYGIRARAVLSAKIYAKTLRLRQNASPTQNPNTKSKNSKGSKKNSITEGTNILTNDTQRIVDLFTYIHFLLFNPIVIISVASALYVVLGASAFLGVAVMLFMVPLQGLVGRQTAKIRSKMVLETDARVAIQGETIRGIRVIKYGAWEQTFVDRIEKLRSREFRWLMLAGVVESINMTLFFLAPSTVAFATFFAYTVAAEQILTPEVAFLSIALFNIISRSLIMLPRAVKAASESVVAIRRINQYLSQPEIRSKHLQQLDTGAVRIQGASLSWSEDGDTVLNNISLSIAADSKLAVVGKVGSGKTSLLMAILNELQVLTGEVDIAGTIAYAAQVPWILSGTVEDNILVGSKKQESRYQETLKACCLLDDLAALPAGDQTEIGERGVNLSGGQKARLSLARACYSDSDIVLLDDPLSAVDVRVARELTRNLFSKKSGLLSGRTVVLVTHNFDAISGFDSIVALSRKNIEFLGCYETFTKSDTFASLSQGKTNSETSENLSLDVESTKNLSTTNNIQKIHTAMQNIPPATKDTEESPEFGGLVEAEGRELGKLSGQVYLDYIKAAGGWPVLFGMILAFVGAQAIKQWSDFWIAEWSNDEENLITESSPREGNLSYALVYLGLSLGTLVLSLFRTSAFVCVSRLASRRIHDRLLGTVMRATQEFFDTNPTGRILNRFAKDMDQMDDLLPVTAVDFLQIAFLSLGAIATIAIVLPWMLLLLLPVAFLYIYTQRLYVKSSRELKRLDGISRSPIYSQFAETQAGIPTIRAFGFEHQFCDAFLNRVDYNHRAYYAFISASRWLAVRLDFLASVIVFFTSLLIVVVRSSLSPGLAGLAITQSMLTTSIFQWGVRQAAETENLFTSVERVTTTVKETSLEAKSEIEGPKNWPSQGRLTWNSVCMRYRENLPLALCELSFSIAGGEKIGIVGRTGAGKSSLTSALFRMVELTSGTISIDGVDIASIPLRDLRKAIAIVPQDPVLFTGTIRENIDPSGQVSDLEMNGALQSVRFSELRDLELGLDTPVADGGSNFSVGERQLLCLARALVSRSKIVVLDEATAAVDNRTDHLMQIAIRESFADSTVITIAHRLHTVADCDRVLILSQGRLHSEVDLKTE